MKNFRLRIFILPFLFLAFAACPWTARSPGQVVDDSAITTEIKAGLFGDPQLSGFAIDVKSVRGEVTLTGTVESPQEIGRATAIANSVSGVKNVKNLLKVQ